MSAQAGLTRLINNGDSRRAILLGVAMPLMHPSALKHEYLTSVANVMAHPVYSVKDTADAVHTVGFADPEHRLPLELVGDDDGSVLHAFVPSPNKSNPVNKDLLDHLQHYEDIWAERHDVIYTHDIAYIISSRKRDAIYRGGLGVYDPPALTIEQSFRAYTHGRWYATTFVNNGPHVTPTEPDFSPRDVMPMPTHR